MSIKRSIVYLLAASFLILLVSLLMTNHVGAAGFNLGMTEGASSAKGVDQVSDLFGEAGTFRTLTNVLLFIIGAVSVIMLIIGGLRYVVSGGDSTAVQGAKNTILYAIVGIIVAILAYAVVSFVIGSFSSAPGVSGGGTAATNV